MSGGEEGRARGQGGHDVFDKGHQDLREIRGEDDVGEEAVGGRGGRGLDEELVVVWGGLDEEDLVVGDGRRDGGLGLENVRHDWEG